MRDYPEVVLRVAEHGRKRSPRGVPTYDLGYTVVELQDPRYGLAVGTGRGLSPRVAAVEALQLIGAFCDPDLMLWASQNFKEFMDDGDFHGGYGRRVGDQLVHVWDKLTRDPDTRRAVVTLWNASHDNEPDKHDYPCTVALGFSLDDLGRLELNTIMRSNDVWLGFPYDVFQFTQLQLTMARILGVEPGIYRHTAWSLHLYEDKMMDVTRLNSTALPSYQPQGISVVNARYPVATATERARLITYARNIAGLTESERWYHNNLTGFRELRRAANLG